MLTTILPMNTKITPDKYQVTATCGEDGVLRQGFHDPASANDAFSPDNSSGGVRGVAEAV